METINTPTGEAMKFVIDGRTFDVATSTKVAISRGERELLFDQPPGYDEEAQRAIAYGVRYEHVLYRTTKGAFFLHEHETTKYYLKGKPIVHDGAFAFAPEKAAEWIQQSGAMVLDPTGLALPPEA